MLTAQELIDKIGKTKVRFSIESSIVCIIINQVTNASNLRPNINAAKKTLFIRELDMDMQALVECC